MARKLVISRAAIRDLEEIWAYIARDNQQAADRTLDGLFRKCAWLAETDGTGRRRDELLSGLLSLPVRRYVVFFVREQAELRIVRILHGARDLERVFAGD